MGWSDRRKLIAGMSALIGLAALTLVINAGDGRPTTTAQHQAAVDADRMPDLVGWSLEEIGGDDFSSVLYQLHDVIGTQTTGHIADEEHEPGTVLRQEPPAGTPLSTVSSWSLTVSAGGPAIRLDGAPAIVQAIAATLDGYDANELILIIETEVGLVYKTDAWAISESCQAVEAIYRVSVDLSYATACPATHPAA
jgi:hypothetical protein